jgi:hypothetical protein
MMPVLGGDDLEVDRREPARDAGEERRQHELEEAHDVRVVADELGALGVVADRVGDAAERGLGEREHRHHRGESPGGDQVVDLDRRAVGDPEEGRAGGAVRGHAALAAEEAGQHERGRGDHLADPERDHRERGARLLRRDPAEEDAEARPRDPADERQRRHRQRELPLADHVERVHREVGAEARVDRVPEREHPALAEEHVVRELEDHHDPGLAHQREREALGEEGAAAR